MLYRIVAKLRLWQSKLSTLPLCTFHTPIWLKMRKNVMFWSKSCGKVVLFCQFLRFNVLILCTYPQCYPQWGLRFVCKTHGKSLIFGSKCVEFWPQIVAFLHTPNTSARWRPKTLRAVSLALLRKQTCTTALRLFTSDFSCRFPRLLRKQTCSTSKTYKKILFFGKKTLSATAIASVPEILRTAIPPLPKGVLIAAIVSRRFIKWLHSV